jgi:hypothetical protein
MKGNPTSQWLPLVDSNKSHRELSQADGKIFPGQIDPSSLLSEHKNATKLSVEKKEFHYIHIPKTAGESFLLDSPFHIGVGSTMQGNAEKTYYETPSLFQNDKKRRYSVVFLRQPTNHVLSQFLECKYDPYFRNFAKTVPGYNELENVTAGFDEWITNFIDMELHNVYGKEPSYRCYEPWNMQARYMTASGKEKDPHFAHDRSGRVPDLSLAASNLRTIDMVGITEYYSASLCLLEYFALDGTLSPLCRQCDPSTGKIMAQEKQHRESHGVPHHSIDMISEQSLQYIENNLTTIDQELYKMGLQLFDEQIEMVWRATGVDLLCRDDREKHYHAGAPVELPEQNSYTMKQVELPENEVWETDMQYPTMILYLLPLVMLWSVFRFWKSMGRFRPGCCTGS